MPHDVGLVQVAESNSVDSLQHPLDPNPVYSPKPVQLTWHRVESDGISVLCRTSRAENGRGFHNTERLYI